MVANDYLLSDIALGTEDLIKVDYSIVSICYGIDNQKRIMPLSE